MNQCPVSPFELALPDVKCRGLILIPKTRKGSVLSCPLPQYLLVGLEASTLSSECAHCYALCCKLAQEFAALSMHAKKSIRID